MSVAPMMAALSAVLSWVMLPALTVFSGFGDDDVNSAEGPARPDERRDDAAARSPGSSADAFRPSQRSRSPALGVGRSRLGPPDELAVEVRRDLHRGRERGVGAVAVVVALVERREVGVVDAELDLPGAASGLEGARREADLEIGVRPGPGRVDRPEGRGDLGAAELRVVAEPLQRARRPRR